LEHCEFNAIGFALQVRKSSIVIELNMVLLKGINDNEIDPWWNLFDLIKGKLSYN